VEEQQGGGSPGEKGEGDVWEVALEGAGSRRNKGI